MAAAAVGSGILRSQGDTCSPAERPGGRGERAGAAPRGRRRLRICPPRRWGPRRPALAPAAPAGAQSIAAPGSARAGVRTSRTRVGAGAAPRAAPLPTVVTPQLRCPRRCLSPRRPRSPPAQSAGTLQGSGHPVRMPPGGTWRTARCRWQEQSRVKWFLENRKGLVGSSPRGVYSGEALTPEVMGERLWSYWEEAADALEV